MYQFKINVIFTTDGSATIKTMLFLVSANSLEEARTLAQEASVPYLNRANGIFISAE